MHASSLENMRKCYQRYIAGSDLEHRNLKVLDVGGADVNGSYADVFCQPSVEYLGADLQPGPGVSVILEDPNVLPLPDRSIDVVVSGQMLEHCEFFWVIFSEFVRVLKDDGFIFLIAPSSGPIHKYPVDCYRFYPDSYRALAKSANCHVVDIWLDNRGPWNDLVGVFNKTGKRQAVSKTNLDLRLAYEVNQKAEIRQSSDDKIQGELPYIDVLEKLHKVWEPEHYLEIGVRHGKSLSLASCDAVGVDPAPDVSYELPVSTRIVAQTSDEFFESGTDPILKSKPDFVFIDGMHLLEYVLRDFINVEKFSGPNTLVVIDDVFPNNARQARRERETRVWTGDVWKFHRILAKYRPDLLLLPINTSPTGLLLVAGLDSTNETLLQTYNPIVREALHGLDEPGPDVLRRRGALSAASDNLRQCLEMLGRIKRHGLSWQSQRRFLEQKRSSASTSTSAAGGGLALSLVVIAFNMARELPRTLKSLCPPVQKRISVTDYEVIVIDNGSTDLLDIEQCKSIAPNIRFLHAKEVSQSPVKAINQGIACARGDLIGVMIDGARMASPGLLRNALDAYKTNSDAAIGTFAFHLGEDVQMRSVSSGYDQSAEDNLLQSVDWEKDAYELFDISVYADSSSMGWFKLPAESNAIFLSAKNWIKIHGYDERFRQPGGGLANLDTWFRICNDPELHVIMLLGEGTFHQFHGGVATNSSTSKWADFDAEYKKIRGHSFNRPKDFGFSLFGALNSNQKKSVLESAYKANDPCESGSPKALKTRDRVFDSKFPPSLLSDMQKGVMQSRYRGIPFYKSPLDIGIYTQLLGRLMPKSVIEVGSKHGGSALWFADMLTVAGVPLPRVISIDINILADFEDDRIEFVECDASDLTSVLSSDLMKHLPRPLMVVEDSSHYYEHSMSVLRFFHSYLEPGDYVVIEDGVCSQLPEAVYRKYAGGPNRAIRDFLDEHEYEYEVDTSLCDFYGFNATYNPNGYLKKL